MAQNENGPSPYNFTSKRITFILSQTFVFLTMKNVEDIPRCTARVILYPDGTIYPNSVKHTVHKDHEVEYEDIRSANNIKRKCHMVHTEFPESSHNISEKAIFYKEIAG